MTSPLVTVVVPTFNRAALLPRALDSVIEQSYDRWEIVTVDDGSTDETADVLDGYADRLGDRLKVIRQPNRGSSAARNAGIDASRGRFIAFLDSDDEFAPSKLERQVELFQRRGELGFVYSDYAYVDLDGTRHDSAFASIHQPARRISYGVIGPGLRVCRDDLFGQLIRRYFIATIVGMVRRDVLGRTIRFAEGQSYAEEWLFFLHVVRCCRAGFVDEPLSIHHHTAGSLARTDAHRNTVRYRNLLAAMDEAFDDLSPEQRGIIRSNLADTYRQLAYDAYRTRDFDEARANFAKSVRQRMTMRALFGLGDAAVRAAAASFGRGRKPEGTRLNTTTLDSGGRFAGSRT